MREKLNKKRDELVKKARSLYGAQVSSGIFNGWLSCQDELLPLIEEMREALEFYFSREHTGANQAPHETENRGLVKIYWAGDFEPGWRAHQALDKLKKWEES
jgi:hypothetical protein